jgi:uncharacterized phage protein gp47/JayE
MTTFDSTGASIDTLGETRAKISAAVKSVLGDDMATDNEDSVVGKIVTIAANIADNANLGIQHAVAVRDPDSASGTGLAKLVKLNGITKNESAYSTVALTVHANAYGVTLQAGDQVSDPDNPDVLWALDAGIVLAPHATDEISATCDTPGAIPALPYTLTKINTPRQGWSSVTNASAAAIGATAETDPALRQRRERVAKSYGKSTLYGVWAALEDYDQVTDVFVAQNLGIVADANGIPGRSLAAFVRGGEDAIIAEVLFRTAPIQTFGSTTVNHEYRGHSYPIKFSRPTDTAITVAVTFAADSTSSPVAFPSWGEDTVKAAVVAYATANMRMGIDAIPQKIGAAVDDLVPGFYVAGVLIDGAETVLHADMGEAFTVAIDDVSVAH